MYYRPQENVSHGRERIYAGWLQHKWNNVSDFSYKNLQYAQVSQQWNSGREPTAFKKYLQIKILFKKCL